MVVNRKCKVIVLKIFILFNTGQVKKIGDHLEFALKYDGVSLSSLKIIFDAAAETEIVDYIKSKPTGKYARRIWFFYEFLTGRQASH